MNVQGYCGDRCKAKAMSPMDLVRHPSMETSMIPITQGAFIPDPGNPANTIRTQETILVEQRPAMICNACLSDLTDIPTAEARYVGGTKK